MIASTLDGAVVLTGGRSARMGQEKALVKYLDQSQLERVVRLSMGFAPEVVVSCRSEQRARFAAELSFLALSQAPRARVRWVLDGPEVVTPFQALAGVVAACPNGRILVSGVDMPLLDVEALGQLRSELESSDRLLCFRSVAEDVCEPFPSIWRLDDALREALREAVAQEQWGFRSFFAAEGARSVEPREQHWLTNANTVEQAQAAEVFLRSHSSRNASICSRLS
jgi:molybdenum cofactor guanylyltransferase